MTGPMTGSPGAPSTTEPDVAGPGDPHDRRLVLGARGLLGDLNRAGLLDAADLHVADRVLFLAGETSGSGEVDPDSPVALAVALAVRAVRGGSVCVDLTTVADDPLLASHAWPEPGPWIEALRESPLVAPPDGRPPVLRLHDDRLLYLDRYWREEGQVCADLLDRLALTPPAPVDDAVLERSLDRVFRAGYDEQRQAARIALTQTTTVLTGGPGTGKTTTVAALLALLVERHVQETRRLPRIALAAPTGKAAARLQEAVEREVAKLPDATDRERLRDLRAVTLHRLLGSRPDTSSRFRHHRDNRLPHDVIVVDETSMVSLTMMARVLEALRPQTRLILVGDPDQLTSVEAGAVLGDLVSGLGGRSDYHLAELHTSHRFGPAILRLAEAVRAGDVDATLDALREGDAHVTFVENPEAATSAATTASLRALLVPHAKKLWSAAHGRGSVDPLEVLEQQRLLCAHRDGPFGVRHWNEQVERWLADETGEPIWGAWYAGRPLLVTANDYGLGVYNGDVGVCVQGPDGLRAHVAATSAPLDLAPSRLGEVETMHAMTIHKSQGSQVNTVVVLLPPPDSRLLTRELLYTAITRAEEKVVVVGSEADVRAAVQRRARRATGLGERLR